MFAQTGAKKPGGAQVKDSIVNARETGEFACNVVGQGLYEKLGYKRDEHFFSYSLRL